MRKKIFPGRPVGVRNPHKVDHICFRIFLHHGDGPLAIINVNVKIFRNILDYAKNVKLNILLIWSSYSVGLDIAKPISLYDKRYTNVVKNINSTSLLFAI